MKIFWVGSSESSSSLSLKMCQSSSNLSTKKKPLKKQKTKKPLKMTNFKSAVERKEMPLKPKPKYFAMKKKLVYVKTVCPCESNLKLNRKMFPNCKWRDFWHARPRLNVNVKIFDRRSSSDDWYVVACFQSKHSTISPLHFDGIITFNDLKVFWFDLVKKGIFSDNLVFNSW